jgi:two-component system, chemotaxis family, response regulator Rcp1
MHSQKTFKNVLLVEDNKAIHHLMREAFRVADFDTEMNIAETGNEAMKYLKKEEDYNGAPTPDLILLDLNLPAKNGLEVMAEIKGNSGLRHIPVVVLTGSNAASDIQACSKYHCKYLQKPSRFHELVELVKSLPEIC